MSAERTVASSSAQPRQDTQAPPGTFVVAPREATARRAGASARRQDRRRCPAAALVAADCAAALLGLLLLGEPRQQAVLAPLLVAGVLLLNIQGRLYEYTAMPDTLGQVPSVTGRIALAWSLTAALYPALPWSAPLPLRTLLGLALTQCLLSLCGRALVHRHRRAATLRRPSPVLVLGASGPARAVAAALLRRPGCGMRPVGIVSETADPPQRDEDGAPGTAAEAGPGLPVLCTEDELQRAVIQNDVRAVLLLTGHGHGPGPGPAARLSALRGLGCDLWELEPRCAEAAHAPGGPRQYVAGFACRPLPAAGSRGIGIGKRLLDIAVSGVLLLVAAPVLAACALVLRAVEGPGVIFRQERVGKDGQLFTLLKFRTHRPADQQEAATRWSVADEHRMSAFCRFLRGTSLDELPQLWNVLRGDMSLVGPRPERPFFVAQFSQSYPDYAHRHRMPTGITGLAQIHGLRGDTSIEDRCRFDNAYIDSWSFWQDLCILLRTLGCLVRRTGS
ncbi:exopolysaccharide biosynthesis polyprenyl glycosylphosphotransferase [Streptomyces sp. NPDC093510]|uniref:exopolysaccharide biosynthesis polyprenyl glycosylphosphotransferase n=1 Tax=Streptomyces sp. NPDC093510 TaxID=3155199 RepID=UPI00343B376E